MTKTEKVLREQIAELEKLIDLKDRRIQELEGYLASAPFPSVFIPSVFSPVPSSVPWPVAPTTVTWYSDDKGMVPTTVYNNPGQRTGYRS